MKPKSGEQFLKNLPEQVIRDGKIVEIRKGVAELLKGKGTAVDTMVKNAVKNESGDWVVQNEYLEAGSSDAIAVLKIRVDSTGEALIIYLPREFTMKEVHSNVVKCLAKPNQKFGLVKNFPRASFDLPHPQNLDQLGLYPRADINLVLL